MKLICNPEFYPIYTSVNGKVQVTAKLKVWELEVLTERMKI